MLRICTINVRGLSKHKFSFITDFFVQSKLDFCFLQETMISDDTTCRSLSSCWSGPSFWALACRRRGGVAVLCSDRFRDNISVWQKDSDGRVLSILVTLDDLRLNLVNIYTPTYPAERKTFFQTLHSYFFPNSELVLGGDFNCYDSALDKMGTVRIDSSLSDLKSSCALRDAWRVKHPRERQFTWFNHNRTIASRLDSFLISRPLCSQVSDCKIWPFLRSDHDFVILDFEFTGLLKRGPGVWKINNSLLEDIHFRSSIEDLIDTFVSFRHVFSSSRELWDALKNDIKLVTIAFSRKRAKERAREKVLLTNRLIALKNRLALGFQSDAQEILCLEASLKALYDKELEGSKIRSRVKWLEEGELPSRYFFSLEKQRHERTLVSSVFNSEGIEVSSLPGIIDAHEKYYNDLFADEEVDLAVQNELLSHVSARLSESERVSCEGSLTLAEASEALKLSNRNRTPGPDGLSVEFYLAFWSKLGPLLVDTFNESLREGVLCDSMKASVTRLVHKKDDRRLLKNWRPISLLNVDYKICSKAISLRLARVLDCIVNPDQTCSVPGRSISSNVILLRDCLDYIEQTGETGILISLDQEKAFDRVDRSFMLTLLGHFGFGPSFVNCIRTLYNGANMQILVNDFLSRPVRLGRGVRQGDALSPLLYVLCVEVLACKIRASDDIKGFLLPGASGLQFKVAQYADDTTAIVKDYRSLVSLFEAISFYERGTGAKLNRSKTKAMWLGSWKDCQDEPLGLTWVRKVKILGVVFGVDNTERDNWEPRLSKLDKSLSLWRSRSLSLLGKVLILNILALSKLLFLSRFLQPPKWVVDKVNNLIWPFLWGGRMETVARRTILCPTSKGGLGLKDFVCQGKAARLAAFVKSLMDSSSKCFFIVRYFCGARVASLRPEWANLRDNLTPSAACPTKFYSLVLTSLRSFTFPSDFLFTSKAFYNLLIHKLHSPATLPGFWAPFCAPRFSLVHHWKLVRDELSENYKNDLMWLITLRAIKVRRSLRDWGYINSSKCASCSRQETIDHCFLHCARVKRVWIFFLPLLSALLTFSFKPTCGFVFLFHFTSPGEKNLRILLFFLKSILYGVWKFRNKAVFHNGKENSKGIIKYIVVDIKRRINVDRHRFSPTRFRSIWVHPAVCDFRDHDNLVFFF